MSDPSRKIDPSNRPRIIILGSDQPEVDQLLRHVKPVLSKHAEIVHEDLTFSDDLTRVEADLVIVFGGDGSILRSARQMGTQQLPVVGVNLGKLGFLADIATDELVKVFPDICAGNYSIVDHLMLSCEVDRDGERLIDRLGLNEVAILGGPPFSLFFKRVVPRTCQIVGIITAVWRSQVDPACDDPFFSIRKVYVIMTVLDFFHHPAPAGTE